MLRFFPFMATGLFLLAAVPAGAASLDSGATVTRSIADFVRPGYVRFHDATTALDKAAANLCKAPSDASLEAARAAFSSAIDSWSQIEIIRFGPVTEENRLERILFWPDRKSIGLKQVQAALADRDRTASDAKATRRQECRHARAGCAGIRTLRNRSRRNCPAKQGRFAAPMARRSRKISTRWPANSQPNGPI